MVACSVPKTLQSSVCLGPTARLSLKAESGHSFLLWHWFMSLGPSPWGADLVFPLGPGPGGHGIWGSGWSFK